MSEEMVVFSWVCKVSRVSFLIIVFGVYCVFDFVVFVVKFIVLFGIKVLFIVFV